MKKTPIILVSICAVVLLVLGSLSNVVGYQSMKSTAMSESPLFSIRTQRAINQQQNILTSKFLGMGKENLLQFPISNNRTELLIKAIEYIGKMDDKKFKQFIELCIQRVKQDNIFRDTNLNGLLQIFHKLRINPEKTSDVVNKNNTFEPPSIYDYTLCDWTPGCIPLIIFWSIVNFIQLIYLVYAHKHTMFSCGGHSICLCVH